MNPELRQLLKDLSAKLSGYIAPGTADADKRRKEVTDAIQADSHDVLWQPVVNVGFAAGRSDRDKEVGDLTAKLTTETTRATGLDAELKTFREKHKDIAAVQDEARVEIEKANTRATKAEELANDRIVTAVRDRDITAFEGRLTAKGMDADYAKSQGILLRERGKWDKDGKLRVMQPGTENIPYAAEGDALIAVLADEVLKKAPKTALVSGADGGGGAGRGGEGGAGGSAAKGFYDGIRAEEQERSKREAEGRLTPAQAFGRAPVAAK